MRLFTDWPKLLKMRMKIRHEAMSHRRDRRDREKSNQFIKKSRSHVRLERNIRKAVRDRSFIRVIPAEAGIQVL